MPPKGASAVEMTPSLTPTIPGFEHALLLGHSLRPWFVSLPQRLGGGNSLGLQFNRSRRFLGVGSRGRSLQPRHKIVSRIDTVDGRWVHTRVFSEEGIELSDRCFFAHRDETRHIQIFYPSSMRLAFFEIENKHAKLHVRGVERDEFARVRVSAVANSPVSRAMDTRARSVSRSAGCRLCVFSSSSIADAREPIEFNAAA